MLRSWKSLGLALIAALGVLALLPGGGGSVTSPSTAFADHDEQITVDVVGTGNANVGFTITGDCSPGTLSIDDNDTPQVLDCDADDGIAKITASTIPAGFSLSDIDCDLDSGEDGATPGAGSDLDDSVADKWVTIDITDNEHWTCVFTFTSSSTPTTTATVSPTVTTTPQISTVTVAISPNQLSCSGSAFVTVVTKNAAGAPVPGGLVTLTTTLGTISPTSATDVGGGVLAVLTAPGTQAAQPSLKQRLAA